MAQMLPCPHLQESLDDTVGVEVSEARLARQALGVYPVTIDLGQVVHHGAGAWCMVHGAGGAPWCTLTLPTVSSLDSMYACGGSAG